MKKRRYRPNIVRYFTRKETDLPQLFYPDLLYEIEKQEKELSLAVHIFTWILGITTGSLISYILYTI